jgi:hypothetical protein
MKPRYGRASLGFLERLLRAGVSPAAALTAARLRFSPAKRTIPGVLCIGEAGLAEAQGIEPRAFRKQARELEAAGALILDRRECLAYVVGAIEDDPPTSKNAVIGFGRQASELPDSPVKTEVLRAIGAVLDGHPEFQAHFADETRAPGQRARPVVGQAISQVAGQATGPAPRHELLRSPDPIPLSDAAAAYQRAWSRLPRPFAAAAVEDLNQATEIAPADFAAIVQTLGSSRYLDAESGLKQPPTLRRLLDDPALRARVLAGEFGGDPSAWRCPDCRSRHEAIADCPPACRGCRRHHPASEFCLKLRQLEAAI